MLLDQVFERFIQESPVSVMVRGLLEKALCPKKLDQLFKQSAKAQYTRELLFSTVVNLMSLVVCGIYPSVHAAHQAKTKEVGVSVTSIYNKLNGIEPFVSAQLVRDTANEMEATIRHLNASLPDLLPGYRVKILDGNVLAATEHRLKVLRQTNSAPMPGKSLVVLDPALMLAVDVFPCEDGHAQERSLLTSVLPSVEGGDVWIADRNFCTNKFLFGIADREGYFVIREHQCLSWHPQTELQQCASVEGRQVFEQTISLSDDDGQLLLVRRVQVHLAEPTRDGDQDIFILTNLPVKAASATLITQLYRKRWTLETLFQVLTQTLGCEIKTLGYPKAALFAFCVALVAYNVLSVVKAALRSVYSTAVIEEEVSSYYLADEIQGTYRGMMIAIAPQEWRCFEQFNFIQLATVLKDLASFVQLKAFRRHPRGPKKPQPKRTRPKNKPHVSTAKLLAQTKDKN